LRAMAERGGVRRPTHAARNPHRGAPLLLVLGLAACSTTSNLSNKTGTFTEEVAWTAFLGMAVLSAPVTLPIEAAAGASRGFVRRHRHGGQVSLDDAYEAAFGVHSHSFDVDPESGRVIHPNPAHLEVLYGRKKRAAGIMNMALSQLAYRYGLVAPRYGICQEALHLDERTYLLVSVVQHAPGTWVPIEQRPSDPMEWFLPDKKTDTVLDWVAIDRTLLDDDRADAYLLAAAVQAILDQGHAPDYWAVSKQWKDGQLEEVMALSGQRAHAMLTATRGPAVE
jgi:hypothetical protein